jgi:DNA-binding NarL/FixJ family response regulator
MIYSHAYPRAAAVAAGRNGAGRRRGRLNGAPGEPLTAREDEVVDLLCDGHNNESIANQLGISEETIKVHLNHSFVKLQVNSRLELAITVLKQRHAEELAVVRRECDIFDTQSN